jgi:hypothetical protein
VLFEGAGLFTAAGRDAFLCLLVLPLRYPAGVSRRQGETAFHVLQWFWYRYFVDMKLRETRIYIRKQSVDA